MSKLIGSRHWLNYLVLLYVVLQLIVNGMALNGPHIDESIYFIGGRDILNGGLESGGYMVWFAGSPFIWPMISAFGFEYLGGLFGARMMATLFAAIALYGYGKFAQNFVGRTAGFWATLFFAVFGPFLHLGHFTVYDVFALAGTTWSCWALTVYMVRNRKRWLIAAGLIFALGVLGKYPILMMAVPMAGLLIVLGLQVKKPLMRIGIDLAIYAVAVALPLAIYMASFWNLGMNQWLDWGATHRDSFGATRESLGLAFAYYGFTTIILGLIASATKLKDEDIPMLLLAFGTLIMWPAYHILSLNGSADQKHVIFSVLFMFPLIGQMFASWSKWKLGQVGVLVLFVLVSIFGIYQMSRLDRSWTDTRPGGRYLASMVEKGDHGLIADTWSTLPFLIEADKLGNRFDWADLWTVENVKTFDPCRETEWVVDLEGSTYTYPEGYMDRLRACGFQEVFRRRIQATPGNKPFGNYEQDWVIYHRDVGIKK